MNQNVGIVGTGWVADKHITALKKIPGVHIAAIAGRNVKRTLELSSVTGAVVYEDPIAMLKKEKLDAVFILLPPHLHGELEKACAEYVKAALVEKPVCNDLKKALEIQKTFEKAGTMVSVAYMNRYRRSVGRMREIFSNPGDPAVTVNGWWITEVPPPLWWRNRKLSGGQFVEQCTHLVDIARFVVGEITEVSAFSAKGFVKDIDQYDTADAMTVNVRFASGAIGNFMTACHPLPGFNPDQGIGMSISSRAAQCALSGWDMKLRIDRPNAAEEIIQPEEDIFEIEDRIFLQAVREKKPDMILSSYADAVKTLRATFAANDSAMTGKIERIG